MLKKLAAQTAIYGISSIIARFLNYLLTPYLTRIMTTGEYGVVTDLYALIPFILLLLTMGMETGYFHFAGKAGTSEEKRLIFQTTWGIVILVSLLFFGFTLLFLHPLSVVMDYAGTPSYLLLMGSIITVDAVTALPFAKLREENKASAYVKIRVVTILVNLFFCIVFYSVIPGIRDLQNIFPAEYGAGYYLISNLIASVTAAFMLIPAVRGIRPRIKRKLLQPLFIYSLPLLISGVTGTANEFIDRQFIKYLLPQESAMSTLGIYGAALKLGGILLLFVQMFRLAAEPFFLAAFKKEDFLKANAETLKYFLIVSMLLFLVISLFSDFFGLILGSDFRDGLFIIPVVLFANIGNGIVFNLSFWYKRTGKTRLAILVTGSGLICTIVFNLLLLPRLGYAGTAWAHLGSEWIMVIVSYILSRIYYPVPYPLKRILFYLSGGRLFYFLGAWQKDISWTGNILFNLSLSVIYTGVVVKVEKINISRHPF